MKLTVFSNTHCKACQPFKEQMTKVLEHMAPELSFEDLNYNQNQQMASALGVKFVPTLVIEEEGKTPIVLFGMNIIEKFKQILVDRKK
jgi:thioredoxin-like negative regulator of GroEL